MTEFVLGRFGGQCPWAGWQEAQVRQAARATGGRARVVDVARHPDWARKNGLFFPFMVLVDGRAPRLSPLRAEDLVAAARSAPPAERPWVAPAPPRPEAGTSDVRPMVPGSEVADACALCFPSEAGADLAADMDAGMAAGIRAKQRWLGRLSADPPFGFVAYEAGCPVAAAEFLPIGAVPYPLPHRPHRSTFLTCVYGGPDRRAAGGRDYRGAALSGLVEHLAGLGYQSLLAVAGRRSPYPNGPVPFFAARGFREVAELGQVDLAGGRDELVLLELSLA